MVFSKTNSLINIKMFEKEILNNVLIMPIFLRLTNILQSKGLNYRVAIENINQSIDKYNSQIAIDILDKNNNPIPEKDEPNCCLMICTPLCFTRKNKIIGVELHNDADFIEGLHLLVKQVSELD